MRDQVGKAGIATYLRLIRYRNCLMSGLGAFIGTFVAAGNGVTKHAVVAALAILVVFLFTGAGNALNDSLDAEIDARGHPERPIPSGALDARRARNIAYFLFLLSVIFAFILGPYALAIVALSLIIMLSYEYHLKRRGLSGNLAIAWLTASLFLFGAVSVGRIYPIWALFVAAFMATLSREIMKDMEDIQADIGRRRTFPMTAGIKNASTVSAAALVGAIGVSPFPFLLHQFGAAYLAIVIAADSAFTYAAYRQFSDAGKAENISKIAMYVALLAFLVGAAGV